jgi:hypothetical protein
MGVIAKCSNNAGAEVDDTVNPQASQGEQAYNRNPAALTIHSSHSSGDSAATPAPVTCRAVSVTLSAYRPRRWRAHPVRRLRVRKPSPIGLVGEGGQDLRTLMALLMASLLSGGCQHENAAKPSAPIPYTVKKIRYCFS